MYLNTLARHRGLRFTREEGEGGGGGTEDNGGKPEDKGGKEYTPPTSQEELDRIVETRLARERAKYADYDSLKEKATQWDALSRESQTEHERAVATAREEAAQEAFAKAIPNVVKMAFRAEGKGLLTDEQIESLTEDLDLLKYANDGGEPILDKITKKVKAFAPKDGDSGRNGGNGRGQGFGQGSGHQQSSKRPGEAGVEEARRRFPQHFAEAGKS